MISPVFICRPALTRVSKHCWTAKIGGQRLTAAERKEAEGLVIVAELLSLLRLRVERIGNRQTKS